MILTAVLAYALFVSGANFPMYLFIIAGLFDLTMSAGFGSE